MEIKNKKIGFVLTGSFSTLRKSILKIKELINREAEVFPIMSYNSYNIDSKYGKANDFINEIQQITKKQIVHTIQDAELVGSKNLVDIIVVCPCTGNTISKLANDIVDTPATMAVKSHLRNDLPVVIAPCTNNGLSRKCSKYRYFIKQKKLLFCSFRSK